MKEGKKGTRIPVKHYRGKLMLWCPMPGVYRNQPVSGCADCENYIRPVIGGILCDYRLNKRR